MYRVILVLQYFFIHKMLIVWKQENRDVIARVLINYNIERACVCKGYYVKGCIYTFFTVWNRKYIIVYFRNPLFNTYCY